MGTCSTHRKNVLGINNLDCWNVHGLIKDIKLQTRFELQPSFKKNNKTIRAITYKSDFDYLTKDGRHIVEDVKSKATEKDKVYRMKRKMLQYKYRDIEFKEII